MGNGQEQRKKLEDVGFTVLRFTDEEVLNDIRNVQRVIEHWIESHPPAPPLEGYSAQINK